MELWLIFLTTLCISFLLKPLFFSKSPKLPPGPFSLPFIGNPLWLLRPITGIESILRTLHSKHGPIISLRIASSRPSIFISSRSLAHTALIHHGSVLADRPPSPPPAAILNSRRHNINSAAYGPTWRLLRRNLTSHILNPSRSLSAASFSPLRRRVLRLLVDNLNSQSSQGTPVILLDHFRHAMFCLLVFMCFGDDGSINAETIEEIKTVQGQMLQGGSRFRVLSLWPRLGKILFWRRWGEFMEMVNRRSSVLVPLIRARIRAKHSDAIDDPKTREHDSDPMCYVDTLKNLELPEEGKRKLTEGEMVSLCSEFLVAGTDTTTTALQWIMANVVKYPLIQERLYSEIRGVLSDSKAEFVGEEELQKMRYLKAVVLEGLRRHPPGHFVVPHSVSEDVELGGYVIPKDATVNFMVAEIGLDPEVWEEPMAFKPERFMTEGEAVDITGSKEIKMMPFGVGRRICPGIALAMLHLEYFVANLVWRFQWKALEGEDVDLTEKTEFTVVMKNPLRAKLLPRV